MPALKLSDWASIAEVVSAIAVVGSLIYVGIEVHRNTVTQVQASTQSLVSEANETYALIARSPDLSCIYMRGLADFVGLDDHSKLRFSAFAMQSLRVLEDLHTQWLEGLVDSRIWTGFDQQMSEMSVAPGMSQWWAIRRQFFNEDFQSLIEEKIAAATQYAPIYSENIDCAV